MTMPRGTVIGLLHPGEMGAAVGKCLTGRGHPVLWAAEGRSPETAARAGPAGLTDVGSAAELAGRADVIFSICPPHAALDVAWTVQGFTGLFVDANAVSPATARAVVCLGSQDGLRGLDEGNSGATAVSARARQGRGSPGHAAAGMEAVPARTRRPVPRRGTVGDDQRLALGRRDGGDRRGHGWRQPAGRVSPGCRRDLPPVTAGASRRAVS